MDRLKLWLSEAWQSRPARKFRKDRWALFCLLIIGVYGIVALVSQLGAFDAMPDKANVPLYEGRVGEKWSGPSGDNWVLWLGTDQQGRSIFVRMLYSTKIAFGVGFVSALIGVIVGSVLGAAAGYFGGWFDNFVVWLYSTVQSIPNLLLLVALTYALGAATGKGIHVVYAAFGATFWIGPCRVVRGEVMKLRENEYVQAAQAMGYGHAKILFKHVLPNTMHLILVYFALLFVGAIKSEVILSYLGLGVQGQPSWGVMINHSRAELINGYYWQIGAATVAMFGLVLCFNVFADALQDALDPKSL